LKGIKYILLLVFFLVSYPALAELPVYGTASESRQAQQYKPPRGKALVYIYQPVGTQSISPTIWINNYKIGRLAPGTFTVWKLSPGRLTIRLDDSGSPSRTIIMKAGQIYRFRLSISESEGGYRAQLSSVPGTMHSELIATRLLKNPRSLTSILRQESARPKRETPAVSSSLQTKPEPKVEPSTQEKTEYISTDDSAIMPGGFELTLKTGSLSLSKGRQTILATDRDFDENASGIFAAEFNYQFDNGLSVGGEFIKYSAEFTTVSLTDTHTVDVSIVLVNAKQYFRTYSGLQPYISAGAGIAVTDVSGPTISGNTAGVAYQLSTGLQYRGANIGIFGELRYIGANTEDDNGETIDVTGSGVFAGVAFHF
jgi:opacity protein-like surface antigen